MIAGVMLGAGIVGVLLLLAADAVARVLGATRRPTRWPWAVAMLLTMVWPIAALLQLTQLLARLAPAPGALALPGMHRLGAVMVSATRGRAALPIDRMLLVGWVALSVVLLARLGWSRVRLGRLRTQWRAARVDGVAVQLSRDTGPAVLGVRRMDVVLPDWMLALDAPLRAMVLCHEAEHVTARDPWLLAGAALAVSVMPWNPALWWQARRLRVAVEIDCDARVLRAHPRPERYGLLLLTIAQRRAAGPVLLAPALSESMSQLERRIVAMRTTASRLSRARLVSLLILAAGAVVLACSVDAPERPTAATHAASTSRAPTYTNAKQPYFEFQIEKPATPLPNQGGPRYPDALRVSRAEGEVLAQFVVDTSGAVDMGTFKVLESSDPLFTTTVRTSLAGMRFSPAQVGGRNVRQVVQMPFEFSLSR
ncbi:MAG TPA: TonB family protein [Gemmatimonadaceae bacterium]|nr:TonB family protein [Gemmatimonadaceae bacterium]